MSALLFGLAGLVAGVLLAGIVARARRRRSAAPDGPPSPPADDQTRHLAALGARLAEVVHELTNPLTAILAFAEDLLRTEPSLEQRQALLVIRHQAKRSRKILRGLLDTVRGETRPRERRLVKTGVLVGRVIPVFEHRCTEKSLNLECEIPPDLPPLLGEETELEQVLTNLLDNAVHASPEGGRVRLTVQVRGRLLEFVVRDEGEGIPPDMLAHIFEPFYTTKPAGEGTGLGLSLAQDIVRRHRGILTGENVPAAEGRGARFTVALPFEDRRWRDREVGPEEGGSTESPAGPGAVGRVLLIEDEPAVRLAVGRFLARHGWIVDEAADGRSALAALLPESAPPRYDAVVCDLRLPGVDGMKLYDRVIADAPALRGRLIVVTGDARSPDVEEFRSRTGAIILEKPYDLDLLLAELRRVTA